MDTRLEAKLIECLSALDDGEAIEQVLVRYPDEAAQLRPYLITATQLPAMRMQPSEAIRMKSREAFLNQAAALRNSKARPVGFFPRFAASVAALVVVIGVVSAGAVAASTSALPGDPLYGLKRTVENVRLSLSFDSASQGALAAQFNATRLDEIKTLIATGRSANVEFNGTIQSILPDIWLVANVTVQIDSGTLIDSSAAVGLYARVTGISNPNGVAASSIRVDSSVTPRPSPTPAPSPTPTPTPAPPGIAPFQNTPQPGVSPSPTIIVTPKPRPTIAPTATPQPIEIELSGAVESIRPQSWTINGRVVLIDAATQIESGISIGQQVIVKALKLSNGDLLATEISRMASVAVPTDTLEATHVPEPTEPRQPTDRPEATQQPEATQRPEATQQSN